MSVTRSPRPKSTQPLRSSGSRGTAGRSGAQFPGHGPAAARRSSLTATRYQCEWSSTRSPRSNQKPRISAPIWVTPPKRSAVSRAQASNRSGEWTMPVRSSVRGMSRSKTTSGPVILRSPFYAEASRRPLRLRLLPSSSLAARLAARAPPPRSPFSVLFVSLWPAVCSLADSGRPPSPAQPRAVLCVSEPLWLSCRSLTAGSSNTDRPRSRRAWSAAWG